MDSILKAEIKPLRQKSSNGLFWSILGQNLFWNENARSNKWTVVTRAAEGDGLRGPALLIPNYTITENMCFQHPHALLILLVSPPPPPTFKAAAQWPEYIFCRIVCDRLNNPDELISIHPDRLNLSLRRTVTRQCLVFIHLYCRPLEALLKHFKESIYK